MTASDLVKHLQKLPADTKIIIRGYEDGYNDILELKERIIIPHRHQKEWYYGEYDDARKEIENVSIIKAVELWGENTKSDLK